MKKVGTKPTKRRETVGGYPAGDMLVSDLPSPPPGPAPGAKARPPHADSGRSHSNGGDSATK